VPQLVQVLPLPQIWPVPPQSLLVLQLPWTQVPLDVWQT
jgi:hypothetical protein